MARRKTSPAQLTVWGPVEQEAGAEATINAANALLTYATPLAPAGRLALTLLEMAGPEGSEKFARPEWKVALRAALAHDQAVRMQADRKEAQA